jgi:hypothetical protein
MNGVLRLKQMPQRHSTSWIAHVSYRGRVYAYALMACRILLSVLLCGNTPLHLSPSFSSIPSQPESCSPHGCGRCLPDGWAEEHACARRFSRMQSDSHDMMMHPDRARGRASASGPMSDHAAKMSPHDAHGRASPSPAAAGQGRKLWIRGLDDARSDSGDGGGSPTSTRISPVKLFVTPERDQQRQVGKRGAEAWHDDALELCEGLKSILGEDVLGVGTETHFSKFSTRSTVGIMLRGTAIDNLVVGGPAHASRSLHKVRSTNTSSRAASPNPETVQI